MARLEDLPIYEQEHLLSKLLPPLGKLEWVKQNKHISEMKFAIITTAGLSYKDDESKRQEMLSCFESKHDPDESRFIISNIISPRQSVF